MSLWTELRLPTEREPLVGPTILPGYMRHAERTEPQELLATMASHFALTGQIVATPVIWATAQVHALLLVTRNTKDFP